MLEFLGDAAGIDTRAIVEDSVVIPPCIIQEGAVVRGAVVGPRVTIGHGTVVERSILRDCLIGSDSALNGVNLKGSMVGNHATVTRSGEDLSLGDHSTSA
jgi:glucose-1-phosphate thymidylyltransferase